MSLKTKLQRCATIGQKVGVLGLLKLGVDRLARRLCHWQAIECLWLDVDRVRLDLPEGSPFEFRFLSVEELRQFALDPINDLDPGVIALAEQGRAVCFAALYHGRLANYGWYAFDRADAEHNCGVALEYPSSVAYMFKGLTLPEFRGHRIHGAAMGQALQALSAERGITSLISSVLWMNFASLKSCDRLGYERLGRIITTGQPPCLRKVPTAAVQRGVRFSTPTSANPMQVQHPIFGSPSP